MDHQSLPFPLCTRYVALRGTFGWCAFSFCCSSAGMSGTRHGCDHINQLQGVRIVCKRSGFVRDPESISRQRDGQAGSTSLQGPMVSSARGVLSFEACNVSGAQPASTV